MSSQLEFNTRGDGKSQCDLIEERLRRTPGQWVSSLELHQLSGSLAVHSRINDLRKGRGLNIERHQTWVNRKCHAVYRIIL